MADEEQSIIETIIESAVASRAPEEVSILSNASTSDLASAVVNVVAKRRGVGMATALSTLLTPVGVLSFPALRQAAAQADGATLGPELRATAAALVAGDAAELTVHGFAAILAAFRQYDIPIE